MAKNGNIHPTRIFKTPDDLKKVWLAYKDDLKKRALEWEHVQYVGRNGDKKTHHPKMPLTFEGLKRYCWENDIGTIEQYFTNQDDCYNDFIGICSHIKNEIREDQIAGGLLGFYNPSITQRLNNLVDKQENTIVTEQPLFGDQDQT